MTLADLTIRVQDGIVYATFRGDIDMSNVPEIRSELNHTTTNQALALVLDLSEVEYLDSAGIHLVHNLHVSLRSRGQKLGLVIPADSMINDALRLAGLSWADERFESAEAAAQALSAAAADTTGAG